MDGRSQSSSELWSSFHMTWSWAAIVVWWGFGCLKFGAPKLPKTTSKIAGVKGPSRFAWWFRWMHDARVFWIGGLRHRRWWQRNSTCLWKSSQHLRLDAKWRHTFEPWSCWLSQLCWRFWIAFYTIFRWFRNYDPMIPYMVLTSDCFSKWRHTLQQLLLSCFEGHSGFMLVTWSWS